MPQERHGASERLDRNGDRITSARHVSHVSPQRVAHVVWVVRGEELELTLFRTNAEGVHLDLRTVTSRFLYGVKVVPRTPAISAVGRYSLSVQELLHERHVRYRTRGRIEEMDLASEGASDLDVVRDIFAHADTVYDAVRAEWEEGRGVEESAVFCAIPTQLWASLLAPLVLDPTMESTGRRVELTDQASLPGLSSSSGAALCRGCRAFFAFRTDQASLPGLSSSVAALCRGCRAFFAFRTDHFFFKINVPQNVPQNVPLPDRQAEKEKAVSPSDEGDERDRRASERGCETKETAGRRSEDATPCSRKTGDKRVFQK